MRKAFTWRATSRRRKIKTLQFGGLLIMDHCEKVFAADVSTHLRSRDAGGGAGDLS
jgi:hypothetical protein